MIRAINDLRRKHGRNPVIHWDSTQNHYCDEHAQAMANSGNIFHAPDCYLNGWAEVVAMCSQGYDWRDTEQTLIDMIERSDGHRDIILNSYTMGYGMAMQNGCVYLTVRGR